MATIIPKLTPVPAPGDVSGYAISWGPMLNGDVGQAVDMLGFADRSIQVEGTFGAGGNAEIQGSNDSAAFRTLHDPLGVLLDIPSASIRHVMEITRLLRPAITAGARTTSLTLTIYAAGSASSLS